MTAWEALAKIRYGISLYRDKMASGDEVCREIMKVLDSPELDESRAVEPRGEPDEFQRFLDNWAEAYPLDVFPSPDFKRVNEVLTAAGLSLDCVSAANMRHVIRRVSEKYSENRGAES